MSEYSFMKGWQQVPKGMLHQVKQEIMAKLQINAYSSWLTRLYGKVEPRKSEAEAIEKIFSKIGITDIWGR